MIKELHLHNWKSFEESVLYIDPLTMIIGTNASGKSNIIEALVFLQKICSGVSIQDALKGIRGGPEWALRKGMHTIKMDIVLSSYNDEDIKYTIGISKSENSNFEVVLETLDLGDILILKSAYTGPPSESKNIHTLCADINIGLNGETQGFELNRSHSILYQSRLISKIQIVKDTIENVIQTLFKIQILDPIPVKMRDLTTPISEQLLHDASNFAGVLAFHGLDKIRPIILDYLKEFPENEIIDLRLDKIGPNKSDAMLVCSEKWTEGENLEVDSRVLSDGTLRFFGIMTAVLTSDEYSLLVIEEIDNGFHPSRARLLIDFLKKYGSERNIDILCTTHNPAFLDSLGIEMMPFISVVYRDGKNGNSKISLLEEVKTLPKMLAKGSIGDMTTQGLLTDYFENEYVGS